MSMTKEQIGLKIAEYQNKITLLKGELSEKQDTLEAMENDLLAYFEDEITEMYEQMLDETYEEDFENFPFPLGDPSRWIKENQPTDYRCGLSDYSDRLDVANFREYESLEDEIADLEIEIESLEFMLEELEN